MVKGSFNYGEHRTTIWLGSPELSMAGADCLLGIMKICIELWTIQYCRSEKPSVKLVDQRDLDSVMKLEAFLSFKMNLKNSKFLYVLNILS